MKFKRLKTYSFTGFIPFYVCILSACSPIGSRLCGNHELQTVYSPNGALKAVVFQRDCGATTGFSTQVSILAASDELGDEAGNAFIADTDHGQAPAGPGGGPEVSVQWVKEKEVEVTYDRRARVFRLKEPVEGVRIKYGQK